jgi:uncharacterized membrane protein YfcA
MDLSITTITLICATFFLAGIVKGATGMGLPTVAMALLGTAMTPVAAAGLLIVPSFVTNVWQLLAGGGLKSLLLRLWPMMLGIIVGSLAGSALLAGGQSGWTSGGLGVVLTLYAALSLTAWKLAIPARYERRLSPLIGLTTGAVSGGTGVFVIPAVPYLQGLGLDKEELIQALGLSFTVSTVALAFGLAGHDAYHLEAIGASLLALPPALLGMGAGTLIRRRVSPATFRRWFLISLLILGLHLTLHAML